MRCDFFSGLFFHDVFFLFWDTCLERSSVAVKSRSQQRLSAGAFSLGVVMRAFGSSIAANCSAAGYLRRPASKVEETLSVSTKNDVFGRGCDRTTVCALFAVDSACTFHTVVRFFLKKKKSQRRHVMVRGSRDWLILSSASGFARPL